MNGCVPSIFDVVYNCQKFAIFPGFSCFRVKIPWVRGGEQHINPVHVLRDAAVRNLEYPNCLFTIRK